MEFSKEDIETIERYQNIPKNPTDSLAHFAAQSSKFKQSKAQEYFCHGLLRRLKTMHRCIHNIYQIWPPKAEDISEEVNENVMINLDSFTIHLFGCLDNLTRAWIEEKNPNHKYEKTEINVMNSRNRFRKGLPEKIKGELTRLEKWLQLLRDRRHPLAHRISPYIPYQIDPKDREEYDKLMEEINRIRSKHGISSEADYNRGSEALNRKNFLEQSIPVVYHSLNEDRQPFYFHPQIIKDWEVSINLTRTFLNDLGFESSPLPPQEY